MLLFSQDIKALRVEMAKNPAEIRKLVCKGCNSEIDEMGCIVTCKYDVVDFAKRDPKTVEVHVYVLTRIEHYSFPKPKK